MTPRKRTLGTCYYPEHWPETLWADDAKRMADLGLTWVRVGEFAWSRLEPQPGVWQFDWLDRAIAMLRDHGLFIVLGTPTATPPRWMLDKYPDMLPVDAAGRTRRFGSRRHYCFSHDGYRQEAARIADVLAQRYGHIVQAWQIDNEYGCHNTTYSYSKAARGAFRTWLAQEYEGIAALNHAWGNVFWSMEYSTFDQIDLPNLTVAGANPAHVLDFRRFSSAQVARFNAAQVAAIRAHSPAPISHNYMGRSTDFDHVVLARQMDIATWDSYPLGFLEDRLETTAAHKRAYARQGDPDFQAFHHDLYRGMAGQGRWWVMEQQPGPVNWAPHNPAPLPGMVRLWTWEAFAHGAECVSYFRWRQAPFGQEQYHAGLLRPDHGVTPGLTEAAHVAREMATMPDVEHTQAPVALVFDYPSAWGWDIQPQGAGCDYFRLVFDFYCGLRKLGLSIDIIPAEAAALTGYKIVLVPGVLRLSPAFIATLAQTQAQVILGPRTNANAPTFQIPVPLPPAIPGCDVRVTHVETLRPDMPVAVAGGGHVMFWYEHLDGRVQVIDQDDTGAPIMVRAGHLHYLGGWPDAAYLTRILMRLTQQAGVKTYTLPSGVRMRETGKTRFIFNHTKTPVCFNGTTMHPAGVFWERLQ